MTQQYKQRHADACPSAVDLTGTPGGGDGTGPSPHAGRTEAVEAVKPKRQIRRKPIGIDIEDVGLLFINADGSLGGAMRIGAETFQVMAQPAKGGAGQAYWSIVGEGDGDDIEGVAFSEEGGVTRSGTLRPRLTGKVITVAGRVERRLAGWLRRSSSTQFFYSVKLNGADHGETLQLPFGDLLDMPNVRPSGVERP